MSFSRGKLDVKYCNQGPSEGQLTLFQQRTIERLACKRHRSTVLLSLLDEKKNCMAKSLICIVLGHIFIGEDVI